MGTLTNKLLLRKPDTTDLVNVLADINDNFDKLDKLSKGELAFAEIAVTPAAFTADTDVLTVPSVTLIAGQKIMLKMSFLVQSTVAGDVAKFQFRIGGTILKEVYIDCRLANTPYQANMWYRLIPGAGVFIYKITASRLSGTGNITIPATGTPSQMVVLDLGQA